ncbi:dimethyladenosine transferase 2, mitochondrial-like [Phoca vitulina]|uniref:dimethyladenosine transferase 2, mitochondrial-like n=1 Tax=Phoca vitulina TaxID=9720 RepID=UPI0013961E68|nr:dimethyladenosine transferase 2, mitochondrial-like [Phoca vitulina]
MSVLVAGHPPRLALSAFAGAGSFCVLGSGAARWRAVLAGHRGGLSDLHPQLVPSQGFRDSPSWLPKYRSEPKSYITSPKLVTTLVQILRKKSLCKKVNGKLEVVYWDFFKMDPRNFGIVKPSIMISETLFRHLGIEAVPCYGRVELNMFITEREYEKLVASPRNPHLYQALSVLWQVACKIKLLHVEPWPSFSLYGQKNLTSVDYDVFFHMLKQCFMKRNFKLMDHLQLLSPVNATAILKQIEKHGDMKRTDLYPQDFKQLFETVECSKESCRWLFDDCMEEMIM